MISTPQKLGIAAVPVLGTFAALFGVFGLAAGLAYQSPFFNIGLNTFMLGVALWIARISVKSFLSTGAMNVLLLGAAVLEFGVVSMLGGFVFSISINDGIAVYTLGALVAGCLHVTSGYLTYIGSPRTSKGLKTRIAASYIATLLVTIIITVAAAESLFSPEFGSPAGAVQLAVLAGIFVTFLTASFFFAKVYRRSHSPVLYWYTLALAMTGFGYLSFFATRSPGDPATWTGITGLVIGSLYFLASIHATSNSGKGNIPGIGYGGRR